MKKDSESNYPINRKSKRFAMGIKIYVFVLTLLVLGILIFLWITLAKYQKGIDSPKEIVNTAVSDSDNTVSGEEIEQSAQEYFLNCVENMTTQNLVDAWYQKHPEHLDKEEAVADFINQNIINVQYECYKDSDFTIDSPKYTIINGENRLVDFELTGSESDWNVSDVNILIHGNESFSATVPEGAIVYINGSPIGQDRMTSDDEYVKVESYEDKLENPVKLCRYAVEDLLLAPTDEDVSIVSENGNEILPAVDDIYYEVKRDENAEGYKDKAENFIKALLNYYTKGKENAEGNMGAVLSHVAPGSAAAKIINGSLSGVIWMTADYTASYELSVSDVYTLADNCCFVDVSYIQTGESKLYNTGDGTYRVYLLNDGNGYKIVQFAGIK